MPGMRRLRQSINQPRRQGSQRPQCPPNQPTPTRCPANQPTTPVTDCVDDTGNLVTRNPGEGKAWPLTFHGKTVTVTHPAGLDTDPHLALRRLRHLALNQFKRTATLRHLHRPHLSHRPTLYRVRLHFTPTYASWLNQVELWFARIERDVIARGVSPPSPICAESSCGTSANTSRLPKRVRSHAEPFSIPPLPVISVSPLTSYTVGRSEGHVCMDNREISQ